MHRDPVRRCAHRHCRRRTDSPSQDSAWHRELDRKSTRLNSSHQIISYAVFCLKKKKKINNSNHQITEYTIFSYKINNMHITRRSRDSAPWTGRSSKWYKETVRHGESEST